MSASAHLPVMLNEVVSAAALTPGDLAIDATFGAGGYSRALLARGARVIAIDRDPSCAPVGEALAASADSQFELVQARFSELEGVLKRADAPSPAAVVFDIGVSSMQLDDAERGFSFMRDGPLDMRMASSGPSAAELVNTAEIDELARIFRDFGEERRARHVANVIASRRLDAPFERTLDLASTVERALGGRRGAAIHPATRVFQALRIAVNAEIAELEAGLAAAERVLVAGGRLVVVTFHSLEDRVVKSFLTSRSGRAPAMSRHLPTRSDLPAAATFDLLFKGALRPADAECAANPRARSAKLRAAVRTAARSEALA